MNSRLAGVSDCGCAGLSNVRFRLALRAPSWCYFFSLDVLTVVVGRDGARKARCICTKVETPRPGDDPISPKSGEKKRGSVDTMVTAMRTVEEDGEGRESSQFSPECQTTGRFPPLSFREQTNYPGDEVRIAEPLKVFNNYFSPMNGAHPSDSVN
jgi:hypothetical protein